MINEQGGINGRRINFITRDDGYSPPKTVELVRKMVEEDQVLALFNTLGTPPNTAIQAYANDISDAAPWAIYGVAMLVCMYTMPHGVVGTIKPWLARLAQRTAVSTRGETAAPE